MNKNGKKVTIFLYGVFFALVVLLHCFIIFTNDDLVLHNYVTNYDSIFQAVIERYNNWEGSWFCQFVVCIITKYLILFKPLNVAVCILIVWSLMHLFEIKKDNDLLLTVIFLFFMFPMGSMSTAGWAVTSIVYLWVVAAGLYSLTLTYRIVNHEDIAGWEYILGCITIVYGANREQSGLFLIILLSGLIIYQWFNKKSNLYILLQLILSLFSWLTVLLAPAVECKNNNYIEKIIPNIEMLSFGEKLYRILCDTFNHFIYECQLPILLFVILIAYMVIRKYNDFWIRCIALFPSLYSIFLQMKIWSSMDVFFDKSSYVSLNNVNDLGVHIPIFLQVLWVACIVASLWLLFENSHHFYLLLIVLVAGIATRLGTVVSAAIKASGSRTSIFFYFAIIYCDIYLLVYEKEILKSKLFKWLMVLCGTLSLINLLRALMMYGGIIPHYIDKY